jgi:hypothetical protein
MTKKIGGGPVGDQSATRGWELRGESRTPAND